MKSNKDGFMVVPYPRNRLLMVDGGRLGIRKHMIHGITEFDITGTREKIQLFRLRTGESLSFAAFFLACLGKAVAADKQLHAYRNWRNQLVIFDDVDVNMLFEVDVDGQQTIRPHILRGINLLSFIEIEKEIRDFQSHHQESRESKFIEWFVRLPGFIRRFFLAYLLGTPRLLKEYYGTVMVSSVGMFGKGSGWGIPVPNHNLQLTLGGFCKKPGVVNDQIEPREFISLTLSFDHDVIDGAQAARFLYRLKKMVENGEGL